MNKLKDIKVDSSKLTAFGRKSIVNGDWHPVDSAFALITAPTKFTVSLIQSRGNLKYSVKKTSVQIVCDTTQDFGTILLAFAYLNAYPEAQKMLWYYLTGNGEKLEVDTELLFREDSQVKDYVFAIIRNELAKNKRKGRINVKQSNYKNQNWLNAFGSINVTWNVVATKIEISLEDLYEWHPNEPRTSQCVHQALARAKEYGAVAFPYHGTKLVINITDLK